jgi:hypothetical protein
MSRNLGSLTIDLVLKLGGFVQGADRAAREAQQLERKLKSSFTNIGRGLATLAGSIGAGFGFAEIIRSTAEAERSFALLENAVRNNAGAAGQTADQLAETAKALQQVTTFSDEAIQSAQTLLLSFRSITSDTFDQATEAALDLATALGKDLPSAALLVGKALEDPIKGMNQLARAGVVFSAEQKNVIESLVKTGQAAEAQAILLDELADRFGNAAKAARQNFAGALDGLRNQFGELLEAKGGLPDATAKINEMTEALADPTVVDAIDGITSALLTLGTTGAAAIVGILGPIAELVQEAGDLGAKIDKALFDRQFGEELENRLFTVHGQLKETSKELERLQRIKTNEPLLFWFNALNFEMAAAEKRLASLQNQLGSGPTQRSAAGARLATQQLRAPLSEAEIDELEKVGEAAKSSAQKIEEAVKALERLRDRARGTQFEISDEEFRAQVAAIKKQFADPIRIKAKLDLDPAPFLTDVALTVSKIQVSATEDLLRGMDEATQTAQEATLAQWAQFEAQLAELVAAGRITAEQAAERSIEVRIRLDIDGFRKQVDEFSDEVEQIREEFGRREQTIDVRVQTGNVSEIGGRRELIRAHQEEAAELQKVVDQYKAVAQAAREAGRPNLELEKEIRQIEAAIEDLKTTTDEFGKILADAFETGVSDALADVAKGVKSLGDAAEDFLQSITDSLLEWASQQVASQLRDIIFNSLPSFGGIFGGQTAGGGAAGLSEIAVTAQRIPEAGAGAAALTASATALTTAGTTLTTGATTFTTGATTFVTGVTTLATAATTLVTAGTTLTTAAAALSAAAATMATSGAAGGLEEIIITTARLAEGGKVFGPGGVDKVPAMLTAGEFVVKAQAVQKPGVQTLLEKINDGAIFRGFAEGGYTGPPRFTVPRYADGGLVQPTAALAAGTLTVTVPQAPEERRPTVVQQSITVNAPTGNISRQTELQLTAAAARGVRTADRRNN